MNYTTIEQSKHLLELGLTPESADCMWEQHNVEHPYITVKPHTTLGRSIGCSAISCWSVGALVKVIPLSMLTQHLNKRWQVILKWNQQDDGKFTKSKEYDEPIDACYEMVVWLLENNYIKKTNKEGN